MALSRDGSSFWSRLRSRPNANFTSSTSSRPMLPNMDIWNLFDESIGSPSIPGSRFRSRGSISSDNPLDRLFTDWFWLTNGNRDREEKPPERVDAAAVLRKCRKVVYKPSSSIWGKAKAEAEQSECPVCLEKLVAKDKLLMLPCNHQFHIDCLTPWIKRNHACCPCCRADIRRGRKRDERANTAVEDDLDAWQGLHEYIMAGLAEVDAERNRFMHEYIMAALAEVDAELNRFMR